MVSRGYRLAAVLALVVLIGIGGDSAPGTSFTRIAVDGAKDDWSGRPMLRDDRAGDAEDGYIDFTTGYAFVNRDALYLLIDVVDPQAPVQQFDVFLRADGRRYLVSWVPGSSDIGHADITAGFEYLGPAGHSSFAFGPALEARIDLRDLRSAERAQVDRVMAMVGECCDAPAWRAADIWAPVRSTPVVDEQDAPVEARTARPGHVTMTDPQLKAEYAYRSFLQLPQYVAWGPDGKLYIADQLGRHVVRMAPDGTMDDLGTWRDPSMWTSLGPSDVGFDSQGQLYVSDWSRIYALDPDGVAHALPHISAVDGFTFGPDDVLFFTSMDPESGGHVSKRMPDGTVEVVATGIPNAEDLVFGLDGTLYVSQHGTASVVRVDVATGEVHPFARIEESNPQLYLAIDPDGDIWVRGINTLTQLTPDGRYKPFVVDGQRFAGGEAQTLALETPGGMTFDDQGRLWITSYNSSVRVLEPLIPGLADAPMRSRLVAPGFCPGIVAGDIEVDEAGNVYAYNGNPSPGEVWRIAPDGQIEVLFRVQDRGNVGMALDDAGRLYLGLPNGEIVWLDEQGNAHHHDWLHVWNMTFGADGQLYAAAGRGGDPRSIVRITGQDRHVTILERFNGRPLGGANPYGPGVVYVAAAPEDGLYVYDGTQKLIYFVSFDGSARLFSNDPRLAEIKGPAPLTTSPTGEVFLNLNDIDAGYAYSLLRFASDGSNELYARGLYGDPLGMAVSPDGAWIYISENGSVDKLPLN